jgi:hypothetical protein
VSQVSAHADLSSEIEPGSLDELVADGVIVRDLLHLTQAPDLVLPAQRVLTIPDPALAVVADLDSYGD